MPWKETSRMDAKLKFVARHLEADVSMAALCREFGISREVGYKWVRRYRDQGLDGLRERSRAPKSCPHKLSPTIAEFIIGLREKHPTWGPRKLLAWMKLN